MVTRIRFKVLAKSWTLCLMDKKKYYSKNNRSNSLAVTYTHKRKICVSPKGRDLETVIHELVHAYAYEMCIKSTNMNDDDQEEFFAELFSKRGEEILKLGEHLHSCIDKKDKSR